MDDITPRDDNIEQRIHKWLEKTGYPFELLVGRTLRDAGWEVIHGRLYLDPITGKTREIDIYATVSGGSREPLVAITIALAVECKSSTDKPWIVFSDNITPGITSQRVPGTLAGFAVLDAYNRSNAPLTILNCGPRIGHGMTRAFREEKASDPSGPYAAAHSAVSAATAINTYNEYYSKGVAPRYSVIEIVMPIALLKGQLFEFYLSKGKQERLEEISQIIVGMPCPTSPKFHATIIYPLITTAEGWPALVKDLTIGAHELIDILKPRAPHIVKEYIESTGAD